MTPRDYLDFIPKVLALCPSTRFMLLATECCIDMEFLFMQPIILPFF
jgi:hypothetical protein